MQLKNKVAILTSAAKGASVAYAKTFATEGARVLMLLGSTRIFFLSE
jgi:NAD(P)-dependent dehydrogenase (short-subunit alcohol dehydrogenase family)